MCKNDKHALIENIQYHTMVGFDHIIIYDNNSLEPLEESLYNLNNVSTHLWTDNDQGSQCRCYNYCLSVYKKYFKWIAFIDTDEFIVLKQKTSIKDFLKDYEKYGGVGINWKCFGSSGHQTIQSSIIKSYNYSIDLIRYNKHIKTIVNTNKAIGCMNPHYFLYKPKYYCVNTNKEKIESAFNVPTLYDKCQINHYITRSKQDFELKLQRGGGNNKKNHNITKDNWKDFENGHLDLSIHEYINRLSNNEMAIT